MSSVIKENSNIQLIITDLVGREHSKQFAECCDGEITIDISNLNAGNYVVGVYSSQGQLLTTKHLRIEK